MSSNTTSVTVDADPAARSPYGYVPTRSIAILFVVLFSISTVVHIAQSLKFRQWWLLPTLCLAGAGEILGWSGRLWSSINPPNGDAFLTQICATILAPTPMVAANFVILGHIISRLGTAYSRLTAKWYIIVFCSFDVIALIIQGTGGGLASTASSDEDSKTGGNIMLGGIVFQLVSITVYVMLGAEYFFRYLNDKPIRVDELKVYEGGTKGLTLRLRVMVLGLALSSLFLYIRAVYRTIELANGWNGKVITTEVYFNIFDGAMIVLAMYTMNIVHPGVFLAPEECDIELPHLSARRI
ncbi:hypothetical protein AMATHDRAFT_69545 [Amanita thiersii Skay4041]|uniref:RTA1 like protein n=1 Tax=Amanita thiersii Skay4041 TaxID=703135 RepID=A0A2A9NE96_9AGAR|nr:hypothetical protein AMATHDRAFT_69545 [Amanita thiersii Skay4041]